MSGYDNVPMRSADALCAHQRPLAGFGNAEPNPFAGRCLLRRDRLWRPLRMQAGCAHFVRQRKSQYAQHGSKHWKPER